MSTSPDAPQGENLSGPSASSIIVRSFWDSRKSGLILLKGFLGLALVVGLLVAMGLNYDLVWDVLVNLVVPALGTLLEIGEKTLDSFFLMVGVGAAFAPMATAYTGFVLLLAAFYLVARKAMTAYQKTQAKKQEWREMYSAAWQDWFGTLKATARQAWTAWWNSLSMTDKVVAGTFMVLVGIPVALLLSFILGSLVANLF